MADSEDDRRNTVPPTYKAEHVRQGRIVLNTPIQRAIFIAGLVGLAILALALAFAD